MQKTKILIATIAAATLTLILVGLASAQIGTNQTYTNTTPNNNDFFGWIGNCFGFGNGQPYTGQYVAPQGPASTTAPEPYAPHQGSYGYNYGYGPCWAR